MKASSQMLDGVHETERIFCYAHPVSELARKPFGRFEWCSVVSDYDKTKFHLMAVYKLSLMHIFMCESDIYKSYCFPPSSIGSSFYFALSFVISAEYMADFFLVRVSSDTRYEKICNAHKNFSSRSMLLKKH